MEDDAPPPYPPRDVGTIHVVTRITLEVTIPLTGVSYGDPEDCDIAIDMVVRSGMYPGFVWEESARDRWDMENGTITVTLSNIV